MELGLELGDDSLFEASRAERNKRSDDPVNYHVKICPQRWFTDCIIESPESPEQAITLKYRADLAFREGRTAEALQLYEVAQPRLGASNRSSWRSLEEDKARCYIRLHKFEEAMICARNIADAAQNFDHTVSVFNLFIDICQAAGRVNEESAYIRQMLLLSPFSPEHWLRLGDLFCIKSVSTCCHIRDASKSDDCPLSAINGMDIRQSEVSVEYSNADQSMAITRSERDSQDVQNAVNAQTHCASKRTIRTLCYCAARSLLSRSQPLVQSFALERNQKLLLQVQEKLKELNEDESVEQKCNSFLRAALAGASEDVDVDNTAQVLRVLQEQEEALSTFHSRYLSFT